MIDVKTRILLSNVRKLLRRGATKNVVHIIEKNHEADIATLLQELDSEESREVFKLEKNSERRAKILSYLEKKFQKELILSLEPKEMQQMVSLMDTDDAADLLKNLPEETAHEILEAMKTEDSDEVADLMVYPEGTAGGLMNTDYLALPQTLTVADAIREIQSQSDDSLITFYVYIIDDLNHLVGVLSLKQLLLSKPHEILQNIMIKDIITVKQETSQEEVAKTVEHYDFLSVPVVDNYHRLMGIITVDDVIDVIRDEATEDLLSMGRAGSAADESVWNQFKARLPWLTLTFMGGVISLLVIRLLMKGLVPEHYLNMVAFIPLILSFGVTISSQAATVAVDQAQSFNSFRGVFSHFGRELQVALINGILFGSLIFSLTHVFFHLPEFAVVAALTLLLLTVGAIAVASLIPFSLKKIAWDPAVGSVPLVTMLVDIAAVLFFLKMVRTFVSFGG